MAVFSGPEIVNDGLVFHYDMGNTEKSWKGKPTTNVVNPAWSNWAVDGSGQGSIGTRTLLSDYHCRIVDVNSNTRQSIAISNILASTVYTFSVKYKRIVGAPTLRFQIQAYQNSTYLSLIVFATTAQLGIVDVDGWQLATYTVTTPPNTNRIVWFMQDGNDYTTYTHQFELKDVQVEQNSFATPFVNGTRSNTEAVRDLTGNNTITANSLTYNSDGTFEFDGTSHSVTIPSLISNTDYSVNAWIKLNTLGRTNPIIGDLQYSWWRFFISSNNQIRAGHKESDQLGGPDVITSATVDLNWHNVAVTFSTNSGLYIYLDGQQVGYQNNRRPFLLVGRGPQYIGQHREGAPSGPNYLDGMLPILSIYTRALSDSEIQQNFEAHRTRFGI